MAELIIQLLSGAVGGNIAGKLLKNYDLGALWNSVVGIVGGGLGAKILASLGVLGVGGGSLDVASIIGDIASSGVGGAVLLIIVGIIKKLVKK